MKSETFLFNNSKGRCDIKETPEEFPLGARGERPISFTVQDKNLLAELKRLDIPGVLIKGSRIDCAFDAAEVVAEYLGEPGLLSATIRKRETCAVPMPGLAEYQRLGIDKKRYEYQGEGIKFLLRRSHAILGDFPRCGKTLMSLGTVCITGSKKTLILSRALGKLVWAEEAVKWLGESAILLYGRAGTDIRIFCKTCIGRGTITDSKTGEVRKCSKCVKGDIKVEVKKLELQTTPEVYFVDTGKLKKDGSPKLQRRVKHVPLPPGNVYSCPVHTDEVDTFDRYCGRCKEEMLSVIEKHKIIICNYDILQCQKDKDDQGASILRRDLPGWAPILAKFKFDVGLCDEIHCIRGFTTKKEGGGSKTRRELVNEVCDGIPRVYGITGTPVYGFSRDLWSPLDFISKGLWS